MTFLTVRTLANSYVDKALPFQNIPDAQKNQIRERMIYDFSVTGFNISTVVTVAALAATIFSHSLLMAILASAAYFVRAAFKEELDFTAVPVGGQPERIINIASRKLALLQHFGLQDDHWQPAAQLLNCVVFMNPLPLTAAAPPVIESQD